MLEQVIDVNSQVFADEFADIFKQKLAIIVVHQSIPKDSPNLMYPKSAHLLYVLNFFPFRVTNTENNLREVSQIEKIVTFCWCR
jgi:hypothetical protein